MLVFITCLAQYTADITHKKNNITLCFLTQRDVKKKHYVCLGGNVKWKSAKKIQLNTVEMCWVANVRHLMQLYFYFIFLLIDKKCSNMKWLFVKLQWTFFYDFESYWRLVVDMLCCSQWYIFFLNKVLQNMW